MWASPRGRSGRRRSGGSRRSSRSAPGQDTQRTRFLQGTAPPNWTPFFAALLLVLAVGSGFALPRAVASANWTLGCWLLGGDTINGMTVCLPQETGEEEDATAS